MRILTTLAIAAFGASSAMAANLVTNGDFEAGNDGSFNSSYTYVAPGAETEMGEAKYSVAHNATETHDLFKDVVDHTTGTGLFMVVNGSSTAGAVVWQETHIAVTSFADYDFSAFITSVYPTSPASLEIHIVSDGNIASRQVITVNPVFGPFSAPGTAGLWDQIAFGFNVGNATSISISFVNQNTALTGNDFGLDDINVTRATVPEPATWGLMIAGFGLVGATARRRRNVVAA